MTRYIDADALKQAIPPTVSSTLSPVEIINTMINAAPTVVPPAPVPVPLPPPVAGAPSYRSTKALVFNAPYSDSANWTNGKTTSYPGYGNSSQTNPGDSKADIISPAYQRPTDGGIFTAVRGQNGQFTTELVTTEGSPQAFKVKTGDVVTFDFKTDAVVGSWPGLWTWNGPSAELDFFEYHGDNPNTYEFTNHVRSTSKPDYPKLVTPGQLSHVEVVIGSNSVDWYVDGALAYQDGVGVPATWSAFLIANLSVAAGNQYHPAAAATTTKIQCTIANVSVYR